jgi:hypothetical protein
MSSRLEPFSWLRHYATIWKVAGASTDEVNGIFFDLPYPSKPHYGPGVDSASNTNEYRESSWGGKGRPALKADNLTAICEPTP